MRLEDPEAAAMVEYVQMVADREPFNGHYVGVREWPDGGHLADQYAVVVEAVYTVLGELQQLASPPPQKDAPSPTDGPSRS